jgi:cobalt-zinc-cadmium efflux system membrane fusion protein
VTRMMFLALVVPSLFLVACSGGGTAPPQPRTPESNEEAGAPREVHLSDEAMRLAGIRTGRVERRALGGGVAIPGEVQFEPSSTAQVGPLVSGRITRVGVTLGARVTRNQLLAVVASSDVSTARARLGQARARLAAAEATLRRQRALSTEGIGAQRAVIDAEALVGELRAEVEGTQRQLALFGSGTAGELQLRSPIDGVVVAVNATLGETASPDRAAFVVTDPTRVWVRGDVPELEIARVQLGSAVIVRLHAFPDLALPGTIVYVAPALDERSRSLPIRVSFRSPDARLRSGLFGSVEVVGGAADARVLVVPIDAVAFVEGQATVFVPGGGANTFRPQAVALGRRAGGFYELREGLAEGGPLAVSGAFTLKSVLRSGELGEAD